MNDVLAILIQSSVSASFLILLVFALRFLFRKKLHPCLRYALWLAVALRLLIPFSFQWSWEFHPILWEVPSATPLMQNESSFYAGDSIPMPLGSAAYSHPSALSVPEHTNPKQPFPLSTALLCGWIGGVIFFSTLFVFQNISFYKKIAQSLKPYVLPSDIYEHALASLRIKKKIPLFMTDKLVSPCVTGLFHRSILLTETVAKEASFIHFALLHEMIHYKHRDNLVKLLVGVVCAIHWFNPFVWLAAKAVQQDMELFCDSVLLANIQRHERFQYGTALLYTAGKGNVALNMSSSGQSMKTRIDMIIKQPRGRFSSGVAVVLCILFCGASFVSGGTSTTGFLQREENLTLAHVYEVTGLAYSLSSPAAPYVPQTYVMNNTNEEKPQHAPATPAKSLWLRYELKEHPSSYPSPIPLDRQILDANAQLLFASISDLETVTFSFIDKLANSAERNEEAPRTYLYQRGLQAPRIYTEFWQSLGENHIVYIYGYSKILSAAGIRAGEFAETSDFAEKVLAPFGNTLRSWDSHGTTVYALSPNPLHPSQEGIDLMIYTNSKGEFEGHGILLSH